MFVGLFFSSRRRHTRCALVTGVQTCALPIFPKGNGKMRPLGIPTADDRIVQEAARMILAAIYEPVFSKHSHGFRAGHSCHTALEEIRKTRTGVHWMNEVDVRGFLYNIDHDTLLCLSLG